MAVAGVLDLWSLTISGYGNGYYAEGALAASKSWTALLTNAADRSGIFHSYYTSAIAAPVAVLAASAIVMLAERMLASRVAAMALAGALLVTTLLSFATLYYPFMFVPWLHWVVLVAGVAATIGVAHGQQPHSRAEVADCAAGAIARARLKAGEGRRSWLG